MDRPSSYLNWVPDGDALKIVEPPSPQKDTGWVAGEPPPFQYMNWLFWDTDQWIQYLDQQINQEISSLNLDQTMRLINGGLWGWDVATGVLSWSAAFNLAIPSIPDSRNQASIGNVTLTDGQVAYVAANIPITAQGTTSNGSDIITNLLYASGIVTGQTVTGTGIPGGTTVASDPVEQADGTFNVQLSANATADGAGINLTFSGSSALTVTAATSSSLLPGPNTVIIARRVGTKVYVGVNSVQSIVRDAEQKYIDENGYLSIYDGTAGQTLTTPQAVYVSPGTGVDSGRTAGRLYPADVGVTNGVVRSAFAGFVMTGATVGNTCPVIMAGLVKGFTSLTVGALYYVDPVTPGAVTSTKPATAGQYVVPVGIAVSSTQIMLNPALLATAAVVVSPQAWPNFFASSESELATAITAAGLNGGGVINLQNSFTIAASHTLPANTCLLGRDGGSIITLATVGKIVMSDGSSIRLVQFTTALTSGNMVDCTASKCRFYECSFTLPSGGTGVAVYVNGSSNQFYRCAFDGVIGGTATGIEYAGGTGSFDEGTILQ